jgi:hypothetical protein
MRVRSQCQAQGLDEVTIRDGGMRSISVTCSDTKSNAKLADSLGSEHG